MIKVLVVEDEPPILRDIKGLIETTNPNFQVIACANNGHQAIAMLENNMPDVIFTDIQMPVIDGLELISYIKEKGLDIIPVILSGYSEFAYAKKAMSLGVTDYLLKPINEKELSGLLLNLEKKLEYKIFELEKAYFSNLVKNNSESINFGKIKPKYPSYLIMLLCAGPFPTYTIDYYSPRKEFWRKNDLEKVADQLLDKNYSLWLIDGKTNAEKVLIFTLAEPICQRAERIAQNIASSLTPSGSAITIVISNPVNGVEEIGSTLQALRSILYKKTIIGFSQIIKQSDSTENNSVNCMKEIPHIDFNNEKNLILYLQQGNIISFKSNIQKLFAQWELLAYPQIWVERFLKDIITVCQRSLPGCSSYNAAGLELEINEAITISNSFKELFSNLWYIFEGLFDLKVQNSTNKDSILILLQKVDRYIKANISEPINTQILSELFGLVPSYLSKLFREYKGISPLGYLIFLRIEKSKELIKSQPNLLTKDIAEIVGYSDPLYFSKIFKKETGLSPSEYKNTYKKV